MTTPSTSAMTTQAGQAAAEPYAMPRAAHEYAEDISTSSHSYHIAMGGAIDGQNSAYYRETYGGFMREDVLFEPNEYVVIENTGDIPVINPRLIINGRRDWYSADRILATVLHPGMTDEEKALALFRHCSDIRVQAHDNDIRADMPFIDDSSNPSRNSFQERGNPVKAANCYYCGGCSLTASTLVNLCRLAGLEARAIWISPLDKYASHCVAEVKYDGKYHLLDPDYGAFYLTADNQEIASYQEVNADIGLVKRTHHCGFSNQDMPWRTVPYGYDRFYPPHEMPVEEWLSTMDITLRPGEKLIRRWDNLGKFRHGDNTRQREGLPYRLANGKLIYQPDLSKASYRRGIVGELNVAAGWEDGLTPRLHAHVPAAPAYVIYKVKSPYPIVGGLVGGRFRRQNQADGLAISLSIRNSDWVEIWSAGDTGELDVYVDVDPWLDAYHSPAIYDYYVKFSFQAGTESSTVGIEQVYLESDLEMAGTSLPALTCGDNQVVYEDDTPGPHSLRIVHGWRESSECTPPNPPQQAVFPLDGAALGLGEATMLRWEPAQGRGNAETDQIADYHVQVSARPDMLIPVSPNLDRLTFAPDPSWQIPEGWLSPGNRYHWRVRARNRYGLWSDWSRTWSFNIK